MKPHEMISKSNETPTETHWILQSDRRSPVTPRNTQAQAVSRSARASPSTQMGFHEVSSNAFLTGMFMEYLCSFGMFWEYFMEYVWNI